MVKHLIIIILSSTGFLYSQNKLNPPSLNLVEGKYTWSAINSDTSFQDDSFVYVESEYSLLRSAHLYNDDFLIEAFSLGINHGTYILARNIQTGAVVWELSFNDLEERADLLNHLSLNDNGELIATGTKTISNTFPIFNPVGNATIKTIDILSGDILTESALNFDDGGLLLANPQGNLSKILPIDESKLIAISPRFQFDGSMVAWIRTLASNTALLDTLGIIENPFGELQTHRIDDVIELSNGNYALVNSNYVLASDTSSYLTNLIVIDGTGQIVNRNEISSETDYCRNIQIKEELGEINLSCTSYKDRLSSDLSLQSSILQMDLDGNIVSNDSVIVFDDFIPEFCQSTALRSGGRLLACTTSQDGDNIVVFTHQTDSGFSRKATWRFEESNWQIKPEYLVENAEGEFLLGLTMSIDTTVNQGQDTILIGGFDVVVKFVAEDISLLTNTQNHLLPIIGKVSPNPFNNEVTISEIAEFNSFKCIINNVNGKQVFSASNLSNGQSIDLSILPTGIYFLRIFVDNELRFTKNVVKN